MRVISLLSFGLVVLVSCLQAEEASVHPMFGYHETHGIPLAKKIKEAEEALLKQPPSVTTEDGRIVGGAIAPTYAYPYLGGLLISMSHTVNPSVCGSSLLSPNRLITAAHCWFDGVNQAWQFEVVLGAQFLFYGEGTRVTTSQVVVHSGWTPSTFANDVAMIYLPTNVAFSQSVQPISLPSSVQLWETWAGWWGRAAGYGRTSDLAGVTLATQVSHVTLQVITTAQCQMTFGTTFVQDSTICTNGAGGVGVCQGDSGGPLVVTLNGQDILVGVSSFVAGAGCQLGFPSAYARVTSFYNWILQNMW